jgi:hypothetical protein
VWDGALSAASHESPSQSLLPRWHARIKHDISHKILRAWHLYTHAGLQALAIFFRSRWIAWRRIVTALSARRRLATYVLATRQRLSNALDIWISHSVKSRALARLGWLHTEKVLSACMHALHLNASEGKNFEAVARTTRTVFHATLLRMQVCAWRHQVHVSRHALDKCSSRSKRLGVLVLHAWLSAISRTRATGVIAEWKASEQVHHIRRRVSRHWHVLARASKSRRHQRMLAAFQRLKRHCDFGCYRYRLIVLMQQRQRRRVTTAVFSLMLRNYSLCNLYAMASDRMRIRDSRRLVYTCFGQWRYHSWRCRRVSRMHKRLHLRACAEVLRRWDALVRESWRLDIKETRLVDLVHARYVWC